TAARHHTPRAHEEGSTVCRQSRHSGGPGLAGERHHRDRTGPGGLTPPTPPRVALSGVRLSRTVTARARPARRPPRPARRPAHARHAVLRAQHDVLRTPSSTQPVTPCKHRFTAGV